MHGPDAKTLQVDLNSELKRWDVPFQLKVDGVYGATTRDAAKSVCYGLGLASNALDHGVTPAIRVKIRHRKLTPIESKRFRERVPWRERLAQRYGAPSAAVVAAISFARAHVGTTESPAGSNRGKRVDEWERRCGVIAAAWCGCFINAVLVAGGFPDQAWLRYCPWIEGRAKSGEGGWTWHSIAEVGDLVLYGADLAHHVGFVTKVEFNANDSETIEGNTTASPGSGDESNGGIVAVRHRHTDGSLAALPIRGFARPPWRNV